MGAVPFEPASLAPRTGPEVADPSPRHGSRALLIAWAACVLIASASLMTAHLAVLPTPAPLDRRVAVELARTPERSDGHVTVVHVLAASCECSRGVIEQLAHRGPSEGVYERVLWVTSKGSPRANEIALRASARGFDVESVTATELQARLGTIGAPAMIVRSADGRIAYVGGYTSTKGSPISRDADIISRIKRGEHIKPLPVLGCAIDKKTARQLDPLGLRSSEPGAE